MSEEQALSLEPYAQRMLDGHRRRSKSSEEVLFLSCFDDEYLNILKRQMELAQEDGGDNGNEISPKTKD